MHRVSLEERRRLTGGGTDHDQPALSPDGRLVVFAEGGLGDTELYLVDRRGRFQRRLTVEGGDATQPSFSPDGTRVAFSWKARRRAPLEGEADPAPPRWEIRVRDLEADGRLTTLLADARASFKQPCFAPDGRRLAYLSDEGSPGNYHLFLLDLETGARTQVTDEKNRNDSHAAFSPDGRRIAFHAYEGLTADRANIHAMDLETGDVTLVTDRPGLSKHPCFADERTIVFHREELGAGPALFAIDLPSGREWRLSPRGRHEKQPHVSRTRKGLWRAAFASRRVEPLPRAAGAFDIVVAELRGVRTRA